MRTHSTNFEGLGWGNDLLQAGQSRVPNPVGGLFSIHIETGPEAHLVSNVLGTRAVPCE